MLIHNGADVNITDYVSVINFVPYLDYSISNFHNLPSYYGNQDDGYSPLHLASKRGNIDAAQVLIKHGANVDIQNLVSTLCECEIDAMHIISIKIIAYIFYAIFISMVALLFTCHRYITDMKWQRC